ncbi:hypothetical protein CASFOL_027919 [Castilleja foliolosa]|uniref:Reverse transcriptase zinc-binding domain-containing protein n=1 Tax=Castilleja foliolosa TaxID=1961234 RepID=A0ABD3CG63_9LAMI
MDSRSASWNMTALSSTFSPETIAEIIKIHISSEDSSKTLLWSPSKSGSFSSNSAYFHSQAPRFTPPLALSFNWNKLWCSKIHNKHKLLIWKIVNNVLPCKAKLMSLFQITDTSCLLCNNSVEDLDHLFPELSLHSTSVVHLFLELQHQSICSPLH